MLKWPFPCKRKPWWKAMPIQHYAYCQFERTQVIRTIYYVRHGGRLVRAQTIEEHRLTS